MTELLWGNLLYEADGEPLTKCGDLMIMRHEDDYYVCRADRGAIYVAEQVGDALVLMSALSVLMYLSEEEFQDDDALQALLRSAERAGENRLRKWIVRQKETQGEA